MLFEHDRSQGPRRMGLTLHAPSSLGNIPTLSRHLHSGYRHLSRSLLHSHGDETRARSTSTPVTPSNPPWTSLRAGVCSTCINCPTKVTAILNFFAAENSSRAHHAHPWEPFCPSKLAAPLLSDAALLPPRVGHLALGGPSVSTRGIEQYKSYCIPQLCSTSDKTFS